MFEKQPLQDMGREGERECAHQALSVSLISICVKIGMSVCEHVYFVDGADDWAWDGMAIEKRDTLILNPLNAY